jgi:hypothetical protein
MLEEIRDNLWAAATRTSTAAASTATEAEAALPVLTPSSPPLTVIDLDEFSDSGSDITDLSTSHNSSGSPGQAGGDLPPEYQAFGEAKQTPLVYGLSGHHVLYHSRSMDFILYSLFTEDTPRDPAFALFQDSAAAEFLVLLPSTTYANLFAGIGPKSLLRFLQSAGALSSSVTCEFSIY